MPACLPLPARREWLQGLWSWLSAPPRHSGLHALASSQWPLLPITQRRLAPLHLPGAPSAALLPGEDWPEGLADVLQRLGALVVDAEVFELPLAALSAGDHVHAADGVGVAGALSAALGPGRVPTRAAAAGGPSVAAAGSTAAAAAAAAALSASEREVLASFLMQERWFRSGTGAGTGAGQAALLEVLQVLPLHEVASSAWARRQRQQQRQQQQQLRQAPEAQQDEPSEGPGLGSTAAGLGASTAVGPGLQCSSSAGTAGSAATGAEPTAERDGGSAGSAAVEEGDAEAAPLFVALVPGPCYLAPPGGQGVGSGKRILDIQQVSWVQGTGPVMLVQPHPTPALWHATLDFAMP